MIIIGADFHPEFQQIALSFTTWVGKLKEVWALACPGFTSAHRAFLVKVAVTLRLPDAGRRIGIVFESQHRSLRT